jgi:hypothetical protein
VELCGNGHQVSAEHKFCPVCGSPVAGLSRVTETTIEAEGTSGQPLHQETAPSQANPWEDQQQWTQGQPQVTPQESLTIGSTGEGGKPTDEVAQPSGSKKWFILGGAAGLVLVVGALVVAGLSIINRGVEVPDVVGQQYTEAQATLEQLELTEVSQQQEYSNTVPKGVVIEQNPSAGVTVDRETNVVLTVSQGPELTEVTLTFDMGGFSAYRTSSGDCDLWLSVFKITYPRPKLVDQTGQEVGRAPRLGWTSLSSNGRYFPCKTQIVVQDVPMNRQSYRLVLDPSKPVGNRSPEFTRETLERNGWRAEW